MDGGEKSPGGFTVELVGKVLQIIHLSLSKLLLDMVRNKERKGYFRESYAGKNTNCTIHYERKDGGKVKRSKPGVTRLRIPTN